MVVAEYDGWAKAPFGDTVWMRNGDAVSIKRCNYHTDLNQIAPVYRKAMGELDALCNQLADSGSQYWVHAAELIGGLKVSISDLDPLAIFHACYEAIVFIQKHSNEKDNNPA